MNNFESKINVKETYPHNEKCPNCNRNNPMSIPLGTTISDFLAKKICFFCGCNFGQMLKKLWQ